jgi:thiamine biosynthesis lipoprotein
MQLHAGMSRDGLHWNIEPKRIQWKPEDEEIAALLPLVDWSAVSVRDGTVFLRRAGMELDLGGVGKEYAVDRVALLLIEVDGLEESLPPLAEQIEDFLLLQACLQAGAWR